MLFIMRGDFTDVDLSLAFLLFLDFCGAKLLFISFLSRSKLWVVDSTSGASAAKADGVNFPFMKILRMRKPPMAFSFDPDLPIEVDLFPDLPFDFDRLLAFVLIC